MKNTDLLKIGIILLGLSIATSYIGAFMTTLVLLFIPDMDTAPMFDFYFAVTVFMMMLGCFMMCRPDIILRMTGARTWAADNSPAAAGSGNKDLLRIFLIVMGVWFIVIEGGEILGQLLGHKIRQTLEEYNSNVAVMTSRSLGNPFRLIAGIILVCIPSRLAEYLYRDKPDPVNPE